MPAPVRRIACRLIPALIAAALAAAAQTPGPAAPEAPVIRTEVREVLVPVVVTNGKGHYVSGLKESDFQVFEDGKPERIIAFATVTGAATGVVSRGATPGAATSSTASTPDPEHTYLIVLDTLHSSFSNFAHVRDALARFFEKERGADAQYAVIGLGREPSILQDSTRDASAVLTAIRSAHFSKTVLDSEAASLSGAMNQFAALMREYCTACRCISAGNQVDSPQCPEEKSKVQSFLTSYGERTLFLNEQFLKGLSQLAGAIATMPTSRTIIFISDGFNRFPGRELYAMLMGYGPKDRTFEFNPRDTQPQLDAVLKLATANNVRFYTIDSRALYTMAAIPGSGFDASSSSAINTQMDSRTSPNISAGVPEHVTLNAESAARESTDPLAQLARETGGLFFENNNDLLRGIRQAVADGREYYLLAYVPENALLDGKYRKIVVTVKDSKWQVHAKAGYWALSTAK